jgi:signal transduction histidine kinase
MKGMVVVDPAKLQKNALSPPVAIERVTVDGTNFESSQPIEARPGEGRLQFEFTALSLVSSHKIRFKYKLEGFDRDWVEAGQRRAAYYTNIPPGQYRFRVTACNNDGVWNTAGASVPFTLSPHFYQTRFFKAICILLVAGLCCGAYRLRISQLRAREKKLILLVDERTHALQQQVQAKERAHAELAEAQQNLIELSRQSGMAEVATSVLHNVGNVLNSVNVGAAVVYEKVRDLRFDRLSAAVEMVQDHIHDLSNFVETDPKGQRVVPYLANLSTHLQTERQRLLVELETMTSHIDHIKQIVATQQDYAKVSALIELVSLPKLAEDAFRMVESSFERHHVDILREFEDVPSVPAAKHKVLEILVNLLRNAKQAVIEHNGSLRQIRVCIKSAGHDKVRVEVHDTGVGVARENLTRIFAHGFTTKPNGHGFGLHSGAIAARQMNGSLWAESDGPGCGATFVLELPMEAKTAVVETSAA